MQADFRYALVLDADEFTLLMHKGNLVTLKAYILRNLHKLETNTQLLLMRVHFSLSAKLPIQNCTSYKSDFLAVLLKVKSQVKQLIEESGQTLFDILPKGIFAITKVKHPYQHYAKDAPVDFEDIGNSVILHLRRDYKGQEGVFFKWLFKMKQLSNIDDAHNKNR